MRTGINPYAPKSRVPAKKSVETEKTSVVEETNETTEEPVEDTAVEDSPVVPAGSIAEVLAWVGDDEERAELALVAEAAGSDRKTLIAKLEAILDN